jgi:hypothetical protein
LQRCNRQVSLHGRSCYPTAYNNTKGLYHALSHP